MEISYRRTRNEALGVKREPFVRMCVGCRKRFKQGQMVRVVKTKDGEFVVGKADGRSTYVCPACKYEVTKTKGLNRGFKCKVPAEIYDKINK